MRYRLDLTLRRAEGALVRVLGAAERRGFQPVSVDGETHDDGDRWHLRMTVDGAREPEGLQQQLAKLYDCLAVEVQPCR
jgi:acetolactate synthase II small subunit